MRSIDAVRHGHLLSLLERFESDKSFATATDTVAAYVSQMKNGTRNMGEAVARRIEIKLGLPPGRLDIDIPLPSADGAASDATHHTTDATQAETPRLAAAECELLGLFAQLTSGQKAEALRELRARVAANRVILKELRHPFDNVPDARIESSYGTPKTPASGGRRKHHS
jgi:hypothetical protein